MSKLKETILSIFGADAKQDEGQHPSSVATVLVPKERFAEAAKALKKEYALLAAEWATDESPFGRGFGIFACYRHESEYVVIKTFAPLDDPTFPSLTKKYVPAYRFERQIQSLMGITPLNHPDTRPWIKFEDWPADAWPLRKTFDPSRRLERVDGKYKWIKAEGE